MARHEYHKLLDAALVGEGDFAALALDRPVTGDEALGYFKAGEPPQRG